MIILGTVAVGTHFTLTAAAGVSYLVSVFELVRWSPG